MARLYLDYNASTPIDPEVVDVMRPLLVSDYGNPSSGHWAATPAKAALDIARGQVAALLGCAPDEVVFTSGGSEANNLALKGLCSTAKDRPAHVITSMIEHPATLEPCRHLTKLGVTVTYVPVDGTGLVDPGDVSRAITRDTNLISIAAPRHRVRLDAMARLYLDYGLP
jgi:cysteine desulfurase